MEDVYEKYDDNYGNMALISRRMIIPYKDSKRKEEAWILDCYALYDNSFHYHRSIHDSKKVAEEKLSEFSCGTFKKVMNFNTSCKGDN